MKLTITFISCIIYTRYEGEKDLPRQVLCSHTVKLARASGFGRALFEPVVLFSV